MRIWTFANDDAHALFGADFRLPDFVTFVHTPTACTRFDASVVAGAVASYAQLARIADRVAQWQERLAPILAAQEAGPPFDILALGRDQICLRFENHKNPSKETVVRE